MISAIKQQARLEGMLLSLGVSMYLANHLSREFRDNFKERDGLAEIRTSDYKVAWCYHIANGKLRFTRGSHPIPDYAMVYKDVPTALEIMSKGTDEVFLQAMMDGAIVFEGDLEFGMWFNDLLKKLGNTIKNKMESLPLRRVMR